MHKQNRTCFYEFFLNILLKCGCRGDFLSSRAGMVTLFFFLSSLNTTAHYKHTNTDAQSKLEVLVITLMCDHNGSHDGSLVRSHYSNEAKCNGGISGTT